MSSGRFFLPGPTEVRSEVLDVMRRAMISHRGSEMKDLMRRITPRLGAVFGTRRPVHVLTGSGTSAMELALRSGSRQRVLSIIHGDFGARFAKLAEACGRSVTRLISEPGGVVSLDQVREALRSGTHDTVIATHNETASGVLADIGALARVVGERDDCLLLVDAVSGAAGAPLHLDEWGVDAIVSASQKAFALPPGLAFAAVSERLVARARTIPDRGGYLDVLQYEKFTADAQSPTTPAVSLLFALDFQLGAIEEETLESRFARHLAMRDVCTAWVDGAAKAGLGVSLLARPEFRSPSVTCIRTTHDPSAIVKQMRGRGYVIGGGQGDLKATTFRIGHMGDHTVAGLDGVLEALDSVLREL